jgi:hypothetical protein
MSPIGRKRHDGSDTMHAGAEAVAKALPSMRARVMALFRERAELTDPELVDLYRERYGPGLYRSIGTRRKELVDHGLLHDTGRRRPNPMTGVQTIIWRLGPL